MKITAEMLRSSMSSQQVDAFSAEWPNGAEMTEKNCLKAAELGLDIDWVAYKFLSAPLFEEYRRRSTPFTEEYEEQSDALWEGYKMQITPLFEEYERRAASLQKEYKRKSALVLATLLKSSKEQNSMNVAEKKHLKGVIVLEPDGSGLFFPDRDFADAAFAKPYRELVHVRVNCELPIVHNGKETITAG